MTEIKNDRRVIAAQAEVDQARAAGTAAYEEWRRVLGLQARAREVTAVDGRTAEEWQPVVTAADMARADAETALGAANGRLSAAHRQVRAEEYWRDVEARR